MGRRVGFFVKPDGFQKETERGGPDSARPQKRRGEKIGPLFGGGGGGNSLQMGRLSWGGNSTRV